MSGSEVRVMEIPIRSTPAIGKPPGADRAGAYEPFRFVGIPAGLSLCYTLLKDESGVVEVYEMKKTIVELLQCPYWIIDILPSQVPEDSLGQYFTVEKYFLQGDRIKDIKQKHINLILKLNCYRDISIDEEAEINPLPIRIASEMKNRYLYIMTGESMILSEPDDTHLTVFNPDSQLLELIRQIAYSEGLFVWNHAM